MAKPLVLAGLFSNQYFDEPLKYQSGMLQFLIMQGKLKGDDANIMALQFFSPIYLLRTVCDRQPKREKECLQKLERHIRQFSRIYKGEDKSYWEKSGWLGKERPWKCGI